jgi:type II secretory pathway predicted ATPase ExeA
MGRISKLELLAEFGFTRDPFRRLSMKSSDHTRVNKVVGMAVSDRSMVSVVGERGIGKSNAVRAALGSLNNVRLVCPYANDINKLLISDIEQAIIFDLSSEKPKRGREVRARQLRRIIGEASTRMDIALVIEEAHHLHGMTLRSLKRLREMEWMGEAQLFSIILVCQSDPMNKPGVSEVRLRSDSINMKGLSQREVVEFISSTMGTVVEEKAAQEISKLPGSANYEDLKALLFSLMENAWLAGRRQVTVDDLEGVFGGGTRGGKGQQTDKMKATPAGGSSEEYGSLSQSEGEKAGVLRDVMKKYHGCGSLDSQKSAVG